MQLSYFFSHELSQKYNFLRSAQKINDVFDGVKVLSHLFKHIWNSATGRFKNFPNFIEIEQEKTSHKFCYVRSLETISP